MTIVAQWVFAFGAIWCIALMAQLISDVSYQGLPKGKLERGKMSSLSGLLISLRPLLSPPLNSSRKLAVIPSEVARLALA